MHLDRPSKFKIQISQTMTTTTTITTIYLHRFVQKKLQIELTKYISDWAPKITMGANLVGCPLYKVLICKTNNQRYMEEKQ